MTFERFKSEYLQLNKKIDWDSVSGVQCVDLAKAYFGSCFDVPCRKGQAPWGNAEAYYRCFNNQSWGGYDKLHNKFYRLPNTKTFVPLEGDVAIWGINHSANHNCGHIAICKTGADLQKFQVWEQNAKGHNDGVSIGTYYYDKDFKGVLRPYYYVNTQSGLNVRYSPSTKAKIVGVKKFGEIVQILDVNNGFGKIGANQWCHLSYLTIKTY